MQPMLDSINVVTRYDHGQANLPFGLGVGPLDSIENKYQFDEKSQKLNTPIEIPSQQTTPFGFN